MFDYNSAMNDADQVSAYLAGCAPQLTDDQVAYAFALEIEHEQADRDQRAAARGREEHERRSRLRGLSNVHISPSKLSIWEDGGLIKVTRSGGSDERFVNPGVRGEIKTMSRSSRRRLMYMLATVKRRVLPIFVTLTYPGKFEGDVKSVKRDLDTWGKRLTRLGAAAVWRIEYKTRKTGDSTGELVPHFHLLLWLPDGWTMKEFQAWCSKSWWEVVGSGSEDHLSAGTSCEPLRSWRGVMYYASKYISKVDESVLPSGVGRMWGVINKALIPFAEMSTIAITDAQCLAAIRLLQESFGLWRDYTPSVTVLVDVPEYWRQKITGL